MMTFDALRLGDILIASGLVRPTDIERALDRQTEHGGRLGDNLVALNIITETQLETILHATPEAPRALEEVGIAPGFLLHLLIKAMHALALEAPSQMKEALKLPYPIVNRLLEEATDRKLLSAQGATRSILRSETRYTLSVAGRNWAKELLEQCQYVGAAPVSLEAYHDRINEQHITNERIDKKAIEASFSDLVVPDEFIDQLGPGINSGRCMLLYGPAGNGKSSLARRIGQIFQDVIYIPYCVEIDGQIMKVFDPSIHEIVDSGRRETNGSVVEDDFDQRWVACKRPVIQVGGELTLDMLDLEYNSVSRFYEAPLHVKAMGGTFIIDDFGRQFVKPSELLNRWIVPLENRVDYMKLHTGKTFSIPFDGLIIFATNLSPQDLMDPAFLRRIPYKLLAEPPKADEFRMIFERVSSDRGLALDEDITSLVLKELERFEQAPLARYQPRFIADQVIAACKYRDETPNYSPELVKKAIANLYVDAGSHDEAARVLAAADRGSPQLVSIAGSTCT